MATNTTNYSFTLPAVNDPIDQDLWGGQLNGNWTSLDSLIEFGSASIASGDSVLFKDASASDALKSDTIANLISVIIPSGLVTNFAGSTAPTGWLLCYGQTIGDVGSGADDESADYEALFDIVKSAYGNAGTESFAGGDTVLLPDGRGRVAAGLDNMGGVSADRLTNTVSGGVDGDGLGNTGGSEDETLTTAQLAAHRHLVFAATNSSSAGLSAAQQVAETSTKGVGLGDDNYTMYRTTTEATVGRTSEAGSGDAHNNVQPTIIYNQIIKT